MPSAMMLLTLTSMTAMTMMAQVGLAQIGLAQASMPPHQQGTVGHVQAEPAVRTGKERLGGKASDEQRVDNCKVPLDLRGSTPRPDDCGERTTTPSRRR